MADKAKIEALKQQLQKANSTIRQQRQFSLDDAKSAILEIHAILAGVLAEME